jgi:YHS domain-containing protein
MRKFLWALLFISPGLFAADLIYTSWHNNLAIKGYDSVAYFTEQKPVKGSDAYELTWQGAIWRFSSAESLALFKSDPKRYAPQYGGHCAYAIAQSKLVGIDPEQFTLIDGKLYLNYNAEVQQTWLAERDAFIEQADKIWPSLNK